MQRALDQLDPDLQPPAAGAVAHFDELLGSFTEPDERGLLRRFAASDAGRQWWWQRIPASGPVRADLERTVG